MYFTLLHFINKLFLPFWLETYAYIVPISLYYIMFVIDRNLISPF